MECSCGDGGALGGVFTGDVDHVRRARLVEVRKATSGVGHRYLLTTVIGWTYGRSSAGCGNATSPNGESAPVRSVASSLTAGSSSPSSSGQPGSTYRFFSDLFSATCILWQAPRAVATPAFTLVSNDRNYS